MPASDDEPVQSVVRSTSGLPDRRYISDETMAPGLTTDDPAVDMLRIDSLSAKNFIDNRTAMREPDTSSSAVPRVGRRRQPPHPDKTRQTITYGLLILVALVVAAYFTLVATSLTPDNIAGEMFDRVFPSLLGLAGTAMGFYFADRHHRGSDGDH